MKGLKPFDGWAIFELIYYSLPDWLAQFQIPVEVMVGNVILKKIAKSTTESTTNIAVLGTVYKMSPLITTTNMAFSYAFGPIYGYALGQ